MDLVSLKQFYADAPEEIAKSVRMYFLSMKTFINFLNKPIGCHKIGSSSTTVGQIGVRKQAEKGNESRIQKFGSR